MWSPRADDVFPVVGSAGAAVLCTTLSQRLDSRPAELWSETLSWIILPFLFNIASQPHLDRSSRAAPFSYLGARTASSRSQWIVAVSVAVCAFGKAENGIIGLFPVLTPLLLAAQKHLGSESHSAKTSKSSLLPPLVNTAWGSAVAAAFHVGVLTYSSWDLKASALSIIPVAALLVVYLAFLPRTATSPSFIPHVNVEEAIVPLSSRIVAALLGALTLQTFVFGFTGGHVIRMLLLGLAKALSWYFMIRTTRSASWCIATTIGTFSIMATRDPFAQTLQSQVYLHIVASVLALGQVIHMLPKQAKARFALWALSLLFIIPYLANVFAIRAAESSASLSFRHTHEHPVEVLIRNSRGDFDSLLAKQSKNYKAACEEYRRRYSAEPPPGFEAWYKFATSNKSPIIDDFDLIYDAISPFWALSGKEVVGMMNDAYGSPDSNLWLCRFSANNAKTHCKHPRRSFDRNVGLLFDKLLEQLPGQIYDLRFLVNHLDEPSVLVPPRPSDGSEAYGSRVFNQTSLSHRPIFDAITKFCEPSHIDRRRREIVQTYDLPFVTSSSSALDLCQHAEYSTMHGFLMAPTSFNLIEGLVPILSRSKPSTMGDILFPSPAYIESEFRYDNEKDTDWHKKRNNLYWAGSTSGGFASDSQWQHHHRQRFVQLAQNLDGQHSYLRESGGIVERVESTFLNSRLFDVAFTRIFQCDTRPCRDQRAYFRVKSWANKDQALRSRLVFDIDGNGMSGRYYKLLASKSVPMKQTIFREWHDERLMPWVHYIPVSESMEELPELVTYLTSTKAGQDRAREIADQGRDWFNKALREVDMSIYTYRLLLELARLQDPRREAKK